MRLRHLIGLACIAVLGAGTTASPAQERTKIAGTPHDLRALTTAGAAADPCAFCHVPDDGGGPPAWNRLAPAGPFRPYASATLKAKPGAPSGASAGCLSCHDGVTPLDALREPETIALRVPGQTLADAYPGTTAILGLDLGVHHPVSVRYGGGGGPAFVPPMHADSGRYVTSVSDGARIPLFGTAPGTVECMSCHDPHDDSRGGFLRTANSGGALCLACHNS